MENPSSKDILNKAFHAHADKDYFNAIRHYQIFIDNGFHDPRVYSNYGVICFESGDKRKAKSLYQKSIDLFPDSPSAYLNMAQLIMEDSPITHSDEYLLAFQYLKKAIEISPENALINNTMGNFFFKQNKIDKAELYYRLAIKMNPKFSFAYSNLGMVLKRKCQFKESNSLLLHAKELNPKSHITLSNFAMNLIDNGDIESGRNLLYESLQLNSNFAEAYYSLSCLPGLLLKPSVEKYLFSESILNKQNLASKTSIYFARANIFHKKSMFKESSYNYELANQMKLKQFPSNVETLIQRSFALQKKSHLHNNNNILDPCVKYIFIVGIPRCGSTLVESILSMNPETISIGESSVLEQSFHKWNNDVSKKCSLLDSYLTKIGLTNMGDIIIDKMLYNYVLTPYILSHIPNARIIHCFRHPLDNILSIFRAQFAYGNQFSSSLIDSSRLLISQDELMNTYKLRFPEHIYSLNYDHLVSDPTPEIKSLIKWLGFKWDNSYLKSYLNKGFIGTSSNAQVRYPIHNKSVGGWMKYRNMLEPAIRILSQQSKFLNMIE